MAGLFYNLGQLAGPKLRKGKWLWLTATGSDQEILESEREVGTDLAAQFAYQLGLDDDAQLAAWTRRIGLSLSQFAREKKREWDFLITTEAEPNAFALPGGYIFIARSLIELVQGDPDRVAFILGHEIAHVIKRHPMQRIMSDTGITTAIKAIPRVVRLPGVPGLPRAVAKLPGVPDLPNPAQAQGWLTDKLSGLLRDNYSQENELFADKLGARLAQTAGYDPGAGAKMLVQLDDLTRHTPAIPLAEYFATHPPISERIQALNQYLDTRK